MPKISVIVPVYNTEQYLPRCIDSILAQTFTDFELLLIDDGSKDNSGKICDEYAVKDSRVRVFHKENGGVSSARNLGLDNAEGDYLILIDADDYWLNLDTLEILINSAKETNTDIVRGEFKIYNQTDRTLRALKTSKKKRHYQNQIINNQLFLKYIIGTDFYSVLFLYRTQIAKNKRFNTERIYLEDMEWIISLLSNPLRCLYIPFTFYAYRHHEGSVTSRTDIRLLRDAFNMCIFIKEQLPFINDKVLANDLKKRAIHIYIDTLSVIAQNRYYSQKDFIIDSFSIEELHNSIAKHQIFRWLQIIKPKQIIDYIHHKNNIKEFIKQLYEDITYNNAYGRRRV